MIRPYSVDLRTRAVAMLDEGASSIEVAELLGVTDSWVRKMRLRRDVLGHLEPGSPPGKERLLSEPQEEQLCLLVHEQPDATLEELIVLMAERMKVRASISTISRRLIEMGMTRKKSIHASEADSPDIQRERDSFIRRRVVRQAARLLFIDVRIPPNVDAQIAQRVTLLDRSEATS